MDELLRTLGTCAKIAGGIGLFVFLTWGSAAGARAPGVTGMLLVMLFNGWAIYAFLRYRQGRQEELGQVLAAAVAGGVPLHSTVQSYLRERPKRGSIRVALEGFFGLLFPLYLYVRLWIGWRRYDELVGELSRRLNSGETLALALRNVRGVASREVILAAAIGEATGTLGECMKNAQRERWSAAWLELAPRILYPCIVLFVIFGITSFSMFFTIPKYVRIFEEFDETLPTTTQYLIELSLFFRDYSWAVTLFPFALLVGISAFVARPSLRWHTPLAGRFYRWGVQAEILRSLGRLLQANRTVPESLDFIARSGVFPDVVRQRIRGACDDTLQGGSLDHALTTTELLPPNMGPLVRSAQTSNTLPWALSELGDNLAGRAIRLMRRVSLIVSPLLILAIGALVAFIALGMFLPLIQMFERLAEW